MLPAEVESCPVPQSYSYMLNCRCIAQLRNCASVQSAISYGHVTNHLLSPHDDSKSIARFSPRGVFKLELSDKTYDSFESSTVGTVPFSPFFWYHSWNHLCYGRPGKRPFHLFCLIQSTHHVISAIRSNGAELVPSTSGDKLKVY